MIDDFKRPPSKPEARPVKLDTLTSPEPEPIIQPTNVSLAEPVFHTPEEVAQADTPAIEPLEISALAKPKTSKFAWTPAMWWRSLEKKQRIIAGVIVGVIVLGAAGGAVALTRQPAKAPVAGTYNAKTKAPAAIPAAIVSKLTGLPVTADQQKLPVTSVMVENSPDARPQSGLKDAGVVFEAIAEGGITRFLALYQEAMPGNIGPIRSSRPYYLQWALSFDAAYAHVGGSPDALADIKSWGVRDLDQFYNAGAYHRITTRYAPHNVYTSRQALLDLQNSKGYNTSTFNGFTRKKEAPSKTPNPTSIDLAISGYYYNVHYDYDATANAYKRSEGGAPHMDADSNTQLAPKVVIALVMPYSLLPDGYHSDYQTIGSGKAYVFQDGTLTTGTWNKPDMKTNFSFTGDDGKPLALDPGQTWISAVGSTGNVTYK